MQVAYSNPPTSAKEMLLAAARGTEGVLEDPPPKIRVVQIDDPLMGYEADLWIGDYAIAPRVFSDFGSLVWYQSHRMEVPLPSPAYDLYHHDPIQEALDAEVTQEEIVERLSASPLLRDIPSSDLHIAAGASRAVRFARGEVIVAADTLERGAFVIWRGSARLVNTGAPSRFIDLRDGDLFTPLTGAGLSGRWYELVALSDCEMVIVETEAAGTLASRNPEIAAIFNRMSASRIRRLDPNETLLDLDDELDPMRLDSVPLVSDGVPDGPPAEPKAES